MLESSSVEKTMLGSGEQQAEHMPGLFWQQRWSDTTWAVLTGVETIDGGKSINVKSKGITKTHVYCIQSWDLEYKTGTKSLK